VYVVKTLQTVWYRLEVVVLSRCVSTDADNFLCELPTREPIKIHTYLLAIDLLWITIGGGILKKIFFE